jgi:hypothetical protein
VWAGGLRSCSKLWRSMVWVWGLGVVQELFLELQFARAEGNAQFLPSGICLASFLFLFKYVYSSIGYGRVMMCSRWCWEMVKIASCGV